MKRMRFLLIVFLIIPAFAVNAQKEKQPVKVIPDTTAADSAEYELVVFDQGFETWLLMQPGQQHSLEYYRARNRIYVDEWNYRYMNQIRYGGDYESYLDYDTFTDYGFEFERRLYYYFRYFEEVNGVRLQPGWR